MAQNPLSRQESGLIRLVYIDLIGASGLEEGGQEPRPWHDAGARPECDLWQAQQREPEYSSAASRLPRRLAEQIRDIDNG